MKNPVFPIFLFPLLRRLPHCLSIAFVLISLSAAPIAWAGFQERFNAFEKEDSTRPLLEFRLLADQGNALAQNYLGVMYAMGQDVPQDYQEAMQWFRKAAEQGEALAQFNLGLMYARGQGVPQDFQEAMQWFSKAAEQGNAKAKNFLGEMYAEGKGVKQDF